MGNNQTDGTSIEVKNLSDESKTLLEELKRIPIKQIDLARKLYESLCKDGFTPMDARKTIENEVELSYRTLMRALPQEAKQKQDHSRKRLPSVNLFVKKPKIPPPEQPIIEQEQHYEPPQQQQQPPEPEPADTHLYWIPWTMYDDLRGVKGDRLKYHHKSCDDPGIAFRLNVQKREAYLT